MRKFLLTATCIFTFSCALWAQGVTGTLSGKVTSADGNAVPNAAVTVTDAGTNLSQKVLTSQDGTFTVSGLPPGTYRVEVDTMGFKRASQQNVLISTNNAAPINIVLEAGSQNETVEIIGRSPAVQANNGEVSVALSSRTLKELPVIDRNHQELVGLQSGVTPPETALDPVRDPARNRYYSVNGQDPMVNRYRMDGVTNQEPFRNTAIRVEPVENLQQKSIETASLPAERGFSGSGVVTDLTKAGTNSWHGSLFEFHSGNWLRTRNFLNTGDNPDPRFVYNQFGGTAGGPLITDKTFFSGSYEGTYQNGSNTTFSTVPTAAALTGNFSGIPGLTLYDPRSGINGTGRAVFPGNRVPFIAMNQTASRIASFLPEPNLEGFTNNYISNVPFRSNGNKFDGRIDQHFSDTTDLFLRYGYTNYSNHEGSPLGDVIGAGTRGRLVAQNAIAGISHEFTPSLITDFRFGYNRWDQKLNPWGDQTDLGFSGVNNNLVGINVAGLPAIGSQSYVPSHPVDNTFNGNWNWGWHSSMHNVKFGADVRRIRSDGFRDYLFGSSFGPNGTAYFGPGGTLTNGGPSLSQYGGFYNSFASFLAGAPSQVGITNYATTPTIRQTQYAAWVGDTIRAMNHLTLDLGVRYEVYSPLEPRNPGGAAFFDPDTNAFNYAGIDNVGMHSTRYDLNNIAPRIGMALQLTDRTVVRGGYSINFFQQPYMLTGFMAPGYGSVTGVQGGYTTVPGIFGPTLNPGTAADTLTNGMSAGNLPAAFWQRDAITPSVHSFSFQVQQGFGDGTMLSAGYVGSLGRHLPGVWEQNAAMPGTGVAGLPFAAMGRTSSTLLYDNGLNNNYNSLQVNLNRRMARGLSFIGSYTWSKALGYTAGNGMVLNPFDLASNYGPLDYDRRHVLSIGHLWELPFGRNGSGIMATLLGGWQINGMFHWASGAPLTVTANPLGCACPGNTVLANVDGNPYLNNGGLAYLDPAAFSSPANGQFGNLGRGALRADGFRNYDVSLFKNFRVHDRFNLQLRGEGYNVTNSSRLGMPVTDLTSASFGRVVSSAGGSYGRQVNLGVRLQF